MFGFLFLEDFEEFREYDTSCFESSILFFKVFLISSDSIKFFVVFNANIFADIRFFLPYGLIAVHLDIFGDNFKTVFPIGRKVLNKEVNSPPIPLPFGNKHLYDKMIQC